MGLDPKRFGMKEGPTSSNCIEFCRYINPIHSHSIRFAPFLAGVEISCTCIRSFPDAGTAKIHHLSMCVILFSGKYLISIFCPINSMSNLSIETSTVETFPKFLSYKHFMGNSSTSSSFPFPKAMNFKQRSPKVFVLQLFGALILISPMLMEHRPFRFTCRLGPWTLLMLNVSSALLAMLKTRGDGGWSTAVVR